MYSCLEANNRLRDEGKYYVNDVKNNWTSTIDEVKTQYVRNEKINNIF